MTGDEALRFLAGLEAVNPYARKDAQLAPAATLLAQSIPAAPLAWANSFAMAHIRTTGQVPSVPELIAGWQTHSQRLIEEAPPLDPPAEADDPQVWLQWERARRAALVSGVDHDTATETADRAIGANRARQITAAPDGTDWQQVARQRLAEAAQAMQARTDNFMDAPEGADQ